MAESSSARARARESSKEAQRQKALAILELKDGKIETWRKTDVREEFFFGVCCFLLVFFLLVSFVLYCLGLGVETWQKHGKKLFLPVPSR